VRRGAIVQLVLIAAAAGGIATAVGILFDWLPEQATEEATRIHLVFWFVTAICIGIFALVAGISVYAVLKFRARPDDLEDGPPIHGHTGLEITWTAVPTALVTAIAIVSAVVLAKNGEAGSNPLRVDVLAQQFAWSFSYPKEKGVTSGQLRVPLGRKIKLHMTSRDVIHSFWVPNFLFKLDVIPGHTNRFEITATKEGTFRGKCAELCGVDHSRMLFNVKVVSPSEYQDYLKSLADKGQTGYVPAGVGEGYQQPGTPQESEK
jgi:cytochrome c oxidase subunit II